MSALARSTVVLLAGAAGLAVANLYYNQPLLPDIARDLGLTPDQVALVPSLTQAGYGLGILTLAPLGDRLERRSMMCALLGLVALCLAKIATARGLPGVALGSLAMGMATVLAHVILPYVGQMAPPEERGKLVGQVMAGILLGILLARTVSGTVGFYLGWRAVFALAAGLAVALAVVLRVALPESRGGSALSYAEILASMARLFVTQAGLREACGVGAALFGAFSCFWSCLAFRLAAPPYGMGARAAGLFGLIGAAGALAAPLFGKVADRRGPRFVIGASIALSGIAYALLGVTDGSLAGLVVGVVLLDLGVQSAMVANQTRIYGLVPGAESRLNAVYMVAYFAGGAAGSSVAARGWSHGGWAGVVLVGLGFVAAGALAHVCGRVSGSRA